MIKMELDKKTKYVVMGFLGFIVYTSIIGLKYLSDLSKNGRYILSGTSNEIIDTRTGVVFSISDCDEDEPFNAVIINARLPNVNSSRFRELSED